MSFISFLVSVFVISIIKLISILVVLLFFLFGRQLVHSGPFQMGTDVVHVWLGAVTVVLMQGKLSVWILLRHLFFWVLITKLVDDVRLNNCGVSLINDVLAHRGFPLHEFLEGAALCRSRWGS